MSSTSQEIEYIEPQDENVQGQKIFRSNVEKKNNTHRSLLMIGLILAVSGSIHHLQHDDDDDDDVDDVDEDDGDDDDDDVDDGDKDDDDDDAHQIVMRL